MMSLFESTTEAAAQPSAEPTSERENRACAGQQSGKAEGYIEFGVAA